MTNDPVCGMIVDEDGAAARWDYRGNMHYFCSVACKETFSKNPEKFLTRDDGSIMDLRMQRNHFRTVCPYLIGMGAAFGVLSFYLGFITLTSDWYNAQLQFREYGIWIVSLAVGLGVQATLFSLYRAWHRGEPMRVAKYSLAASGGVSTTAMAACCAHYLVVILPLLGLPFLSAAAGNLAGYQTYFFMAGIVSNLFGIGLMIRMIYRSGMIQPRGFTGHWTYRSQQLGS